MIKFCTASFIITRIFYIAVILIVFNTGITVKYDLSPEIILIDDNNIPLFEKKIQRLLVHFSSYDAIMFYHIAKNYYTNDSNFAFFPLFPTLLKHLSKLTKVFFSSETTSLLFSGYLLSNLFCYINSILLYSLIYNLTRSKVKSKICSLLFLINPGTMFYMSIYSENLCFTLQLIFIYILVLSESFLPLIFLIPLLILTRSNTLLLCSYFVIPCLRKILTKEKDSNDFSGNFFRNFTKFFQAIIKNIFYIGIYVLLCIEFYSVFYFMSKYFPTLTICESIKNKVSIKNSKYSLFEDYCNNGKGIENFYSYIQKEYWNVGLFKQLSLDSLDRIILSLPMNICSCYILIKGFKRFDFKALLKKFDVFNFLVKEKSDNQSLVEIVTLKSFILGGIIYLVLLMMVLIFMAHPQINNRLISGTPILYYFLSEEIENFLESSQKGSIKGFLVLIFFVSFSLLSCVMQVGQYGFA